MQQTEEKVHSRVGASSAKRWMNCPGSVALCKNIPNKTSIYAAEGTVAHSAAEMMLVNGLPSVLPKDLGLVGEIITEKGYEIKVTIEMIEAAYLYGETIFNDLKATGMLSPNGEFLYMKNPEVATYLSVEKGFCLKSIDEELFGTNDASICIPFGKLIVYDFKYGAGVAVDAEENEQLMFYALGVAEELGGLENLCLQEVELVIIQPRANHSDGPVRRWSTTPERLMEFAELLKVKLKEVRDPKAKLCSGSWCKFCDAKSKCPEIKNRVNSVAQMEFAPIDLNAKLESKFANVKTPPAVADMSPKDIANVLENASMVRDWITSVENHALEMMKTGHEVPGYKVVAKKANRAWANEDSVVESFEAIYGDGIYTTRKLLTPAQLEKIIGKECVKEHVVIPDAGYTVAKLSDKRPAITPAVDDFEEVGMLDI